MGGKSCAGCELSRPVAALAGGRGLGSSTYGHAGQGRKEAPTSGIKLCSELIDLVRMAYVGEGSILR